MLKGTHHDAESKAKLSRAGKRRAERERRLAKVAPAAIRALERGGSIAPSLRPLARRATEALDAWLEALGGADSVSPQRRSIAEHASLISLLISALAARVLQGDDDPELATRIGTLVGVHRAQLVALGLDRVARDATTLSDYLARQNATSEAIGSDPARSPTPDDDRSAGEDAEGDA